MRRTARCPQRSRKFVPEDYLSSGVDEWDCTDLASQADAQAVLRFSPQDPNKFDPDGDGVACPDLPPPRDVAPVQRTPSS